MTSALRITIATRESPLALWQAHYVRDRLVEKHPQLRVEILGMTTQGDRELSASLAKIGGKGLFVKELELALADGRADIAVHSMKDVPMELSAQFRIAAILEREDPRDALVSHRFRTMESIPSGAVVGTSSLRRSSQILARFPTLKTEPLRGNVQTRLRKLDEGHYAAIILAAAGLRRLGLAERITSLLQPEESLPAAGQGALGIECLTTRSDLLELLSPLNHVETDWCVRAEREVSRALSGSCIVPIGAYAELLHNGARLRSFVAAADGKRLVRAEVVTASRDNNPEEVGREAAGQLLAQGAADILSSLSDGT